MLGKAFSRFKKRKDKAQAPNPSPGPESDSPLGNISSMLSASGRIGLANLLANLTNDFWFGKTTALVGHEQLARFRAIENRRSLLRCTMTGSTCAVLPTGRVAQRLAITHPEVLVVEVPLISRLTLYTRLGDTFSWVCVVLVGGALIVHGRRARVAARDADPA